MAGFRIHNPNDGTSTNVEDPRHAFRHGVVDGYLRALHDLEAESHCHSARLRVWAELVLDGWAKAEHDHLWIPSPDDETVEQALDPERHPPTEEGGWPCPERMMIEVPF